MMYQEIEQTPGPGDYDIDYSRMRQPLIKKKDDNMIEIENNEANHDD